MPDLLGPTPRHEEASSSPRNATLTAAEGQLRRDRHYVRTCGARISWSKPGNRSRKARKYLPADRLVTMIGARADRGSSNERNCPFVGCDAGSTGQHGTRIKYCINALPCRRRCRDELRRGTCAKGYFSDRGCFGSAPLNISRGGLLAALCWGERKVRA